MLKFETFKVFQARDVFDAVRERYAEDVEGDFNEIYCPPQDGAVLVTIPLDGEEMADLSPAARFVMMTLWEQGGLQKGESCYIHFDY